MTSMQRGHTTAFSKVNVRRTLCWMLVWTAVFMMSLPALAAPPNKTAPRVASKAGNVTALLPLARIVRGAGKTAVTADAKRGDEVYWNDLVRTEKGGRARLTLTDQSILSLGSQAELRIVKHDARTQQTALELGYGRLRAEVATVTRNGGNFTVRTPTAVAGVIGTVFGSDTTIDSTKFLCISGVVSVGSSDPGLPEKTTCEPGMAVIVGKGKAPVKRPATTQEIQQFIQDTEPTVIQAISPASALAGSVLEATVSGTHLNGISSVTAGSGVTASLNPNGITATSATLHLVVQPSAAPGPHVFTLLRKNGQTAAVVFNVLAPPGALHGPVDLESLKKPYYDVLDQERQSELAGLNGLGLTIKDSADGAANQLEEANQHALKPISLSAAGNDLQKPVSDLNDFLPESAQRLLDAQTDAQKSLDIKLQAAIDALQGRSNGSTPDDRFGQDVADAFNTVNKAMLDAFKGTHSDAGTRGVNDNLQVGIVFQNWLNQINQSNPGFDNKEQTAEIGAIVTFDASKLASNASSIQWSLCDSSYRPTSLGHAISVQSSGCKALAGFGSGESEFQVATCSLNAGDYPVRVVLNNQLAYETMLHILRPSYDDPGTRLSNLANSYSTLRADAFMAYFDSANYPGYTTLYENIRKTMLSLSSINVLVRLNGAPSVVCNDATLSAQWQSNYTFRGVTDITTQRPENITVRMHRSVGQGWFVTDFQGDNGTVQGVPPGPNSSDAALADLTVNDAGIIVNGTYTKGSNIAVSGGPTTFGATIQNVGNAAFTGPAKAVWTVNVGGTVLPAVSTDIPILPPGATSQIQALVQLPSSIVAGTPMSLTVNLNPGSQAPEKRSDNNSLNAAFTAGTLDLKVSAFTLPAQSFAGLPAAATVTIQNLGTGTFGGGSNDLVISSADMPGVNSVGNIPAIIAGGQVTVNVLYTPTLTGAHTLKAAVSPSAIGDLDTTNDALTVNVAVLQAFDLTVKSLTLSSNLIGGQASTATVVVSNLGSANFPGQTNALTLTNGSNLTLPVNVNLPAIGAGGSATLTIPFIAPMTAGSVAFTSKIAGGIAGDTTSGAHTLTTAASVTLPYDLSVKSIVMSTLIGSQAGTATIVVSNAGPITFPGQASALTLTAPTTPALSVTVNFPTIAAGGTATVIVPFTTPSSGGTFTFTSTIAGGIVGDTTSAAHTLATSASVTLPYDLGVQSIVMSTLIGSQAGTATIVVSNAGPIGFPGQASALKLTAPTTPALSVTVNLPAIAAGGTATVIVPFTTPSSGGTFTFTSTIAGGIPGDTTSAAHTLTTSASVTLPYDLSVTSIAMNTLIGGQSGTATIVVSNAGPIAFPGQASALTLTAPTTPALSVTVNLPAIAAGGTSTVTVPFTTPPSGGTFTFTSTITGGIPGDTTSAAHTLSSPFTITLAAVDLQISTPANGATDVPPFLSGQPHSVNFTVTNLGNVASSASDAYSCALTRAASPNVVLGTGTLASLAAGATTSTISVNYTVPKNYAGTDSIVCSVTQDPLESVSANNTSSLSVQVNSNINLAFATNPSANPTEQMGHSGIEPIDVINLGGDDAPAGWNVVITFATQTGGTAVGPALAAGASTTVNVPFTVPQLGPAPQSVATTAQATINQNAAVVETTLADNTFSVPMTLVDFTAAPIAPGLVGVAGRSFNVPALVTTNPAVYPLVLTYSAAGVPAGLTLNPTSSSLGGIPSASGLSNIVVAVAEQDVTHPGGTIALNIVPEITVTPVGVPPTIVPGNTFTVQLNVAGGVGTITLVPTLPTGITPVTTLAANPDGSGNLTWQLQASLSAPAGAVSFPIQVTDSGVGVTATPAANFTYTLNYNVTGQANYQITSAGFTGKTAPYTGTNALQSGEPGSLTIVVANNGNSSPTGTLTLSATCAPGCSGSSTGTGAAPAVGSSTTITIPLGTIGNAAGSYTGTVVISAAPAGSISTSTSSFGFDVVDFTATPTVSFPTMNIPVGGSGQIPFTFAVSGTTPLPSIPLTASGTTAGVSYSGITNPVANGTSVTLNVAASGSVTSGATDTVVVQGTNDGFTKTSLAQPVKYYTISMAPQTGVNDSSNPFNLAVLSAVPSTPSQIILQLAGNFDTQQGGANVTVLSQSTGLFPTLIGNTGVLPGGLVELDLYALTGASGLGTVQLQVTIPETNPAKTFTYTFYVNSQVQVDLALVSITPQTAFSASNPWLIGEPATFDVVVQNVGTSVSNGADKLQIQMNGRTISAANQTIGAIAAGQSTTIPVTINLPDYPWGTTISMDANIYPSLADPNPNNNSLGSPITIPASDWALAVSGVGATDSNPIQLNGINGITGGSASISAGLTSGATSWTTPITLQNGATSTGFTMSVSGSTSITSASQQGTASLSATAINSVAPGPYFVQVIGTVGTVQRQATVHINVTNSHTADPVTLTVTGPGGQTGIAAQAPTIPSIPVQVNGPLAEQVSLTPSCNGTCQVSPTVDMTFTEGTSMEIVDVNTVSNASPTQLANVLGASLGTTYQAGLLPVLSPDGTIVPTSNIVAVSLTNPTYARTVPYRTPTPDPIGSNSFNMLVNVGDVVASPSLGCAAIPPSTSLPMAIQIVAVNNFNANLSVAWFDGLGNSLSPSILSVSGPGAYTYSGGYASQTFTFSNANASPGSLTIIMMGVTFASRSFPSLTTTKYFPLAFDLTSTGGFCPTIPSTRVGAARPAGAAGGNIIRGFYGKHNATLTSSTRVDRTAVAALPDVQVTANDLTFSPSVPKPGDNVEVRFRLKNLGTAAKSLPVALQMNGVTVAKDTFDVPANGAALGALHWDSAKDNVAHTAPTMSRIAARRDPTDGRLASGAPRLTIVIDPDHTISQASATNKVAAVGHFMMQSAEVVQLAANGGVSGQRVMMELGEGVCAGFRFATGPSMSCGGSADFTITVQDLGNGQYVLESPEGIADLGNSTDTSKAKYGPQVVAQAGHIYAVDMASGQTGLLTVHSISNRLQLTVQSQKIFRKVGAVKVIKSMGGGTNNTEPGDITDGISRTQPTVYLDLGYQVQ
jgi:FecR protein/CARDB